MVERNNRVQKAIKKHYEELGPVTYAEKSIILCFIILSLLWFFRSPGFMSGWGDIIETDYSDNHDGEVLSIADATPAILVMMLLFFLPKEVNISIYSFTFMKKFIVVKKFEK